MHCAGPSTDSSLVCLLARKAVNSYQPGFTIQSLRILASKGCVHVSFDSKAYAALVNKRASVVQGQVRRNIVGSVCVSVCNAHWSEPLVLPVRTQTCMQCLRTNADLY